MKKYIRASFDNWVPDWLIRDNGAKQALSKLGIDLKKAVFSKEPSGRGKDYPIYFLDNHQVYIPDVYGAESYVKDMRTGDYRAAKYIAKKNLPITDVVYVSKEGFEKEPRDRYVDPRYKREGGKWEYQGQYQTEPWTAYDGTEHPAKWVDSKEPSRFRRGQLRDKSGYEIPDPADRLTKFYNSDEGTKKLAARLQNIYEELTALKDQIFALDFTSFGGRGDDYDYTSTDYQNLLGNFGDTCRDYRIALHNLEVAVKDFDTYKDRRYSRYNIKSVFEDVSHIERKIKDYKKAIETGRYW